MIGGCENLKNYSQGNVIDASLIVEGIENYLAILKVAEDPRHVFALSANNPYPLQDIIVAGFFFGDRVSSMLQFTRRIVSSIAGIGDNYS